MPPRGVIWLLDEVLGAELALLELGRGVSPTRVKRGEAVYLLAAPGVVCLLNWRARVKCIEA